MHTIPMARPNLRRTFPRMRCFAEPSKLSCRRTATCGGRLLHDSKGDGTLERVRHFSILQVFRHHQRRGPVHLLMPVIPVPGIKHTLKSHNSYITRLVRSTGGYACDVYLCTEIHTTTTSSCTAPMTSIWVLLAPHNLHPCTKTQSVS